MRTMNARMVIEFELISHLRQRRLKMFTYYGASIYILYNIEYSTQFIFLYK